MPESEMDIETFLALPSAQIAALARQDGPKVCVLPVNGTRRWFLLAYPPEAWRGQDFLAAYHSASVQRQLEIYRLMFDHGVDTLMVPLFGPDLMERGEAYQAVMMDALVEMAQGPVFTDFYREYGVRVGFYGDYRKYLGGTRHAPACDVFDRLSQETAGNGRFRLLYGLFAHDPAETVAEIGARFFQAHGRLPDRREIVRAYYRVDLPPVSFFIGFDRFSAFDMPLVATGQEDLYFSVSPSFSIDQEQLRRILYDHLIARRVKDPDYESLPPQAVDRMRRFYALNHGRTQGIGAVRDGVWYPLPNLDLPDGF